jgi:hypothetical protein
VQDKRREFPDSIRDIGLRFHSGILIGPIAVVAREKSLYSIPHKHSSP